MTQDEQKEREAFEAWASQEYPYSGDARSGAWVGWKARAAYESARTQQVMGDGSATIAPMSDASAPITPATQQPDVTRPCTCPAGNEPQPCMRKFAVSDCAAAYRELQLVTVLKQAREALDDVLGTVGGCHNCWELSASDSQKEAMENTRTAIDNELKRMEEV